jgi:hypothetical protein
VIEDLLAERACARLIAEFVRHLDLDTPSDVAALFTLPPPPATQVGDYLDRFRQVDGTWLLERRTLVLAFGGPTARA